MTDKIQSIHRLFRRLLQKNRFIRKLTHTGLSRAEVHVLVELQSNPGLTVSSFVPMLRMDQSSISRLIQGLVKRQLLDIKPDPEDLRQRIISISKAGKSIIGSIDKIAGALFQQFAERLTEREGEKLADVFSLIADHCGQPKTKPREGESRLRSEQRRSSRGCGVLGPDIFGSGLSSSQWHVLSEICQRSHPVSVKELSHLLGIPPNSLSVILDKFEKSSYIKRRPAPHDSRVVELDATPRGQEFFEKIELIAAKSFREALAVCTNREVDEIENILIKYVGEGEAKENVLNSLPGNYKVWEISGGLERRLARAFVVRELVARGHEKYTPEILLCADSLIVGLYEIDKKQENLKAVAEILISGRKANLNVLAWASEITQNILYSFMVRVRDMAEISEATSSFIVAFEPARGLFK